MSNNSKTNVNLRRKFIINKLKKLEELTKKQNELLKLLEKRVKDNTSYKPNKKNKKKINKVEKEVIVEDPGYTIAVYSVRVEKNNKKRYKRVNGKKVRIAKKNRTVKSFIKDYDPRKYSFFQVREMYSDRKVVVKSLRK